MKIRREGEEFTYRQLIELGRLPKEGIEGTQRWSNGFCQVSTLYWRLEDTYMARKDELESVKEKINSDRNQRRRELYRMHREETLKRKEEERKYQERARKIAEYRELCAAQETVKVKNKTDIVVFDTETTGLNSFEDEILQFSAVDGEGKILLNTYVKAYFKKEWPEASRINKITPDMVADAPELWELAGKIRGVMESGKMLVAYNAAFDLDFLEAVGYRPTNEQTVYDVMLVFAEVYGEYSDYHGGYKWQKLTVAANYFGYQFEAHDSLEDVRATLYCYNKIKEMNK